MQVFGLGKKWAGAERGTCNFGLLQGQVTGEHTASLKISRKEPSERESTYKCAFYDLVSINVILLVR